MKILIISYNKLPYNDAGAIRDLNFAKILHQTGNDVCIIGMGNTNYQEIFEINGLTLVSLRKRSKNIISKLYNYFTFHLRIFSLLNNSIKFSSFDLFWIVDIPINSVLYLKKYAKKNNIKLIHDSVEWYSPEQFGLGKFSPLYIHKQLYNSVIIDEQFSVICISNFLQNHFSKRGLRTCRIPALYDNQDVSNIMIEASSKLILLYAGTPGKKDYLETMLLGLSNLDSESLSKVELRIIGVTIREIESILMNHKSEYAKIKNNLIIYGRRSRDFVIDNLKLSNFTILLRPSEKRYAKAGFPSKIVESLAFGVPSILNISSDLDEYLINDYNSIIVNDCSITSFKDGLVRALKFDVNQLNQMKQNAKETFFREFEIKNYESRISSFITKD